MSVCEWLGDLFSLNRDVECLIEMERCSMKKSLAFKRLVLLGASVLGLGAVNVLSVAAQDDSSESSSEGVNHFGDKFRMLLVAKKRVNIFGVNIKVEMPYNAYCQ